MDDDIDLPPKRAMEDSVFDESVSTSIEGFDDALRAKFKPEQYAKLRTIGAFISQGLSLDESCILARIAPAKFKQLMESDADIAAFIVFKQTAYKGQLLKVLTGRAKDGDFKTAGWLLERKYPREFNAKPPSGEDDREPHLLEQGLQYIRQNGDKQDLVKVIEVPVVQTGGPLSV